MAVVNSTVELSAVFATEYVAVKTAYKTTDGTAFENSGISSYVSAFITTDEATFHDSFDATL